MRRDNVLFKNRYLLGVKNTQATPTKQDLGASMWFFSKFSMGTPLSHLTQLSFTTHIG